VSQRALLLAVRDHLRQELSLATGQCEVQFDGQPPPVCSELFVAVHPGDWANEPVEGLLEVYGVEVTVTIRVARVPQHALGPNALVGPSGESLDNWLEKIRAVLHLDKGVYPVLTKANALIGSGENGFIEPLRFQSGGRPQPRGPDWFSADTDLSSRLPPVGLSQTLIFGGARRVQVIEEQS